MRRALALVVAFLLSGTAAAAPAAAALARPARHAAGRALRVPAVPRASASWRPLGASFAPGLARLQPLPRPAAATPAAARGPVRPEENAPPRPAAPALPAASPLAPKDARPAQAPEPSTEQGPADAERSPRVELERLAQPKDAEQRAAAAFDGARPAAPPAQDALLPAAAKPAALKPAAPQRRALPRPVPTVGQSFERGARYAVLGTAAYLVYWDVVPALFLAIPLATLLAMEALATTTRLTLALGRLALRPWRGKRERAPASRRSRALGTGAGALLGMAAMLSAPQGVIPWAAGAAPPIMAAAPRVLEALDVTMPFPTALHAISGDAVAQDAQEILSRNPVGRELLEELRDRGGALRMPSFHVVTLEGTNAIYSPFFNAILLSDEMITDAGYTLEQFKNDPEIRRDVLVRNQDVLAHELQHAAQYRRSPLAREYYSLSVEREYEAYTTQFRYDHARLMADPHAADSNDFFNYRSMIADMITYLREHVDEDPTYRVLSTEQRDRDPRWTAWRAELMAELPRARVEGFRQLALRYQQSNPVLSAHFMHCAREAAAEAKLPAPAPLPSLAPARAAAR